MKHFLFAFGNKRSGIVRLSTAEQGTLEFEALLLNKTMFPMFYHLHLLIIPFSFSWSPTTAVVKRKLVVSILRQIRCFYCSTALWSPSSCSWFLRKALWLVYCVFKSPVEERRHHSCLPWRRLLSEAAALASSAKGVEAMRKWHREELRSEKGFRL